MLSRILHRFHIRIVTSITALRANSFWLVVILIGIGGYSYAQQLHQKERIKPSLCTRENALTTIQEQIDFTKTFDDDVARITVLIRSANLLWPYEEKRARSAYADAFEFAMRNHKEKGDELTREGKILIRQADQRYTVIGAIARHDSAWAKRLTEQMLKDEQQDAQDKIDKDKQADNTTAERLLTLASSLVSSDETAAVSFARDSLRYPATFHLSEFLYDLVARDKAGADQFYQEALATYSSAPVERLLYLSSYPFGNNRDAGDMPGYTAYQVPPRFAANPNLQRMFVQALLRRAQNLINDPSQVSADTRVADFDEIWLALTRLQGQIEKSLPDLAPAVEAARTNIGGKLSPDSQRDLQSAIDHDNSPTRSFDERVEAALKKPNVDARDQELASAILSAAKDETLDHVLSALDKISDSSLHQPLLNWLYFERAQRAIKDQKLDEARKLAAKVDELDQRAFLYSHVAEESLKQHPDQTQAREVLEEVLEAAGKAPDTQVKVRALLGVAYLYAKFDTARAIAVIGQAVQSINRIEHPDFRLQAVIRKIEGKTFASYASVVTPGFTPENAFREISKVDFDSMLNQASNFSDKSLRATTTLAIVEQCLKDEANKPSAKPN
jgi:hypothetical protein